MINYVGLRGIVLFFVGFVVHCFKKLLP